MSRASIRIRESAAPCEQEPLLSSEDLAKLLSVSRRTIDRLRARGTLPRPTLYVSSMPRWKAGVIHAWIDTGGVEK
jgi:predicted DNA-binding transcriptional regulator AlpA